MEEGFLYSVFGKYKVMGRGCLGRPWCFTVEASEVQEDRNVSEMIRCSKSLMWENEMEQMSSPGARSSDFCDSLVRLPCVTPEIYVLTHPHHFNWWVCVQAYKLVKLYPPLLMSA